MIFFFYQPRYMIIGCVKPLVNLTVPGGGFSVINN